MTPPTSPTAISRRGFLQLGTASAVGVIAAACQLGKVEDALPSPASGRLTARPGAPTGTATPGLQRLALGGQRDGLLYVPSGYSPASLAPLVVMLHGAGGSAQGALQPFLSRADGAGLVLVAPESRGMTWDAIRADYGPDIAFIDRALESVFARVATDPDRLTIEGFSDGATYALGVGLTNGDLFPRVVAFSPGFLLPVDAHGSPRVYIAHGTRDTVLPIDQCSRRIVPELERRRYDVTYHEFDGPHTVPPEIAGEALAWMERG